IQKLSFMLRILEALTRKIGRQDETIINQEIQEKNFNSRLNKMRADFTKLRSSIGYSSRDENEESDSSQLDAEIPAIKSKPQTQDKKLGENSKDLKEKKELTEDEQSQEIQKVKTLYEEVSKHFNDFRAA